MAAWSRLYYGDLPCLLAAAVAGDTLQVFALVRNSLARPYAVGTALQLTAPAGRAKAAIAVINLHRLLCATEALLPRWVLPVDLVQKQKIDLATCGHCE